jgi:hypothetical protein
MVKYIVWHIQGGLGKNVAATSLPKTIKETYSDRKLIMVVSYPEVFLNNPYVDRVYPLGNCPYFYEDFIDNKDTLIFKHEPYHQTGHIHKNKHLISNWCDLLNIKYNNQTPELYPNYSEKINAKKWFRDKPVVILQTSGGELESNTMYSWCRDIPQDIAQLIVDKYKDTHHIFHITRKGGYILNDVERMDTKLSNMELFGMLTVSSKRFLIDSSLQHAAVAINLKSTVLWIGTSPNVFGYELHNNIVANKPKRKNQLIGSYLFDYQFDNNVHECPYNTLDEMFDLEKINYLLT